MVFWDVWIILVLMTNSKNGDLVEIQEVFVWGLLWLQLRRHRSKKHLDCVLPDYNMGKFINAKKLQRYINFLWRIRIVCILMAGACWCMAETNTILQSNYPSIKNKRSIQNHLQFKVLCHFSGILPFSNYSSECHNFLSCLIPPITPVPPALLFATYSKLSFQSMLFQNLNIPSPEVVPCSISIT